MVINEKTIVLSKEFYEIINKQDEMIELEEIIIKYASAQEELGFINDFRYAMQLAANCFASGNGLSI